LETLKNRARSLNLDDEKGYVVAVLIALVVVSILIAAYYPVLKPPTKTYTTIYLLDSPNQAADYPELLVINQNNTFTVPVTVENHMGNTQNCTVLLKITSEMIHKLPLTADANATYTKTLENGGKWEFSSTITINQPGTYTVIFELWACTEDGELQFTENACSLNVGVVNQS